MNCTGSRWRRMRNAECSAHAVRHGRACRRALAAAAFVATVLGLACVPARAAGQRYSFAVVSGAIRGPADEAATQRLIEAAGLNRNVAFIVYDGNLKGPTEACSDALYERREAVLETARPALIFVPGQYDWVGCSAHDAGDFDPVERLDRLRQTLFADPTSMGQTRLPLTRESEVSRFRPYRENVRWQVDDTIFIGLNVPGGNNHYLTAGGRNGEFEDRTIANAFWLEHAGEYARRHGARAIVIFIQGDPDPERYERPDRFAWLRFARHERRDGYLEFKRSLVKLAETFRGPVVVIHEDDGRPAGGFQIDQPLRNDKGARVANLTRIAFAPRNKLMQWIEVDADMARHPPFRVSVRDVPKDLPLPQPPTLVPGGDSAPPVPAMPTVPEVSSAPDVPAPSSAFAEPASQPLDSGTGNGNNTTHPGYAVPPPGGTGTAP
ncbi:hypothetical protein [Paraburkholderia kururiensis]|uniref:hypothetical protein n=1 Tax=Paraburkholderia kururiensis TaxID=984307 RepID=UPI001F168095|nr:hypothetical protein [Paraburkholderia kururiensis]